MSRPSSKMGHVRSKTRSRVHVVRFKHSAWCPLSNSSSFHAIFTKLGQKLYLDDLGQVLTWAVPGQKLCHGVTYTVMLLCSDKVEVGGIHVVWTHFLFYINLNVELLIRISRTGIGLSTTARFWTCIVYLNLFLCTW